MANLTLSKCTVMNKAFIICLLVFACSASFAQPADTLMAWIYPGEPGCNASAEYSDGRVIQVLKPEYYHLNDDGSLTRLTVEINGCNAYSKANLADIKAHSRQQFCTVSGDIAGMDMLDPGSLRANTFITTLRCFVSVNKMTGIELDIEGFEKWTEAEYRNYKNMVTALGNALQGSGLKLMVDGPAIPDRHYQTLLKWKWQDFNSLPVDYFVVMAYDYQYDHGAGFPVSPLTFITDVCNWMNCKIKKHNKIVIGINSYGYHGVTGGYNISIDTYTQSRNLPGFNTAVRDKSSGEMTWSQDGVSYFYCDSVSIDLKRKAIHKTGLNRISIWHLGGNQWLQMQETETEREGERDRSVYR